MGVQNPYDDSVIKGAGWSTETLKAIKEFVDTLETAIGAIEGATTLHNKLTAARAALLDQITALRLAELDAANIPADVDTLKAAIGAIEGATTLHNKLTAARAAFLDIAISSRAPSATALTNATWTDAKAGYLTAAVALASVCTEARLAELAAANLPADIDTLLVRLPAVLSAARIGYLDNINQAGLLQVTAARAALLDQITAARLAELDAANIPADLDTIKGYLDTEIAAILAAVDTEVAAILAYVDLIDDATNGLAAIKAEVEGLAGAAMRGTDGAALAASWTAALATALGNYTAARAGYLDNINQAGLLQVTAARAALLDQITAARLSELDAANIPADIDGLKTSRNRQLFSMDFWSVPQISVVLPAGAATQTLPDVVVDALPGGMTVVKAIAIFKFRILGNAGAANKLNGAQHIGIQKGGAGGFVDAISLVDDQFGIAAATREGGDVVVGDHNVVAKVDAIATYNFQWTSANADVAGLTFYDLQMGLRVLYSV